MVGRDRMTEDGLPMTELIPGDTDPGDRGPGWAGRARTGSAPLPSRAHVVIIGGGVIGTSVAYHLTLRGVTDVLLLEQGQLSCGTTWHAAGLVGQLRASESGTRLVQYSTQLYGRLEAETGLATGFRRCGGVTVARTADRMTALRRTAATAEAFGLECELIGPARAAELYPIMETSDLVGALCGMTVPLHSAEHFYVVTDQISGAARDLPVLRDPDGYTYIKEEVGGLLVGGFEPDAKPWVPPDQLA